MYTVTATIHHTDAVVVTVTLDGEALETTPAHPFLVLLRGWVDAEDLRPGMAVRRADGSSGAVEHVAVEERNQAMDHLTVADAHTFVVGDDGWVVHNGCEPGDIYVHADGVERPGFDPRNAHNHVKLGYTENLRAHPDVPGIDYQVTNEWYKAGLAPKSASGWRQQLSYAMGNTKRINFLIEGMDPRTNIGRYQVLCNEIHCDDIVTHGEMDEIILRGLTGKLRLYNGSAEVGPLGRYFFIREWKASRPLIFP